MLFLLSRFVRLLALLSLFGLAAVGTERTSSSQASQTARSTTRTTSRSTGSSSVPSSSTSQSAPLKSAHAIGKSPMLSFTELYRLQLNFLDAFIYPNNVRQAHAVNSTIFAKDVKGRVDITRTFEGRELNTEYIFGLFANLALNPNAFTLMGYATSYEIVHFAASQNTASASTRFNFSFPVLGNRSVPIVIDTWNTFNGKGEIVQYDATFKWWQWAVKYLLESAAVKAGMNQTTIQAFAQKQLATSICGTATKFCNGTNQQYPSNQDCINFLTKDVRFGESYELGIRDLGFFPLSLIFIGRNTLLCRMVHQNMVPLRPSVHCSHLGPNGGGYCADDATYEETAMLNYFGNSSISIRMSE